MQRASIPWVKDNPFVAATLSFAKAMWKDMRIFMLCIIWSAEGPLGSQDS